MELGSIEREIYVEAPPEVVFEVVSRPEHVSQWWADEALYEAAPGASGCLRFGDPARGGKTVSFDVVEVEAPRSFSFRWIHPAGERATEGNSLLVTFALAPSGSGTLLRMTETGYRELGWEAAQVEAQHADHSRGWDHFVPRLAAYAASLPVRP